MSAMGTEAQDLRRLAADVENLARESRAYSMVWEMVRVFCDHLSAKARVIESRETDISKSGVA